MITNPSCLNMFMLVSHASSPVFISGDHCQFKWLLLFTQLKIDETRSPPADVSIVFKSQRRRVTSPPSSHQRLRHATSDDGRRYSVASPGARHVSSVDSQATLENVWVRQAIKQFVAMVTFHLWSSMLQ